MGTIHGLKGGLATIKVNVQVDLFGLSIGTISVNDPGARLSTIALVVSNLTPNGTNGVSGTAYGLAPNPNGKTIIYALSWTL
jgi:hypothetical protein